MANFERRYPHVTRWVKTHGWIEMGNDGMSHSWVRALDEGGLIWEGGAFLSQSLDEAFQELDAAPRRMDARTVWPGYGAQNSAR